MTRRTLFCSFCYRAKAEGGRLFGEDPYICERCVEQCNQIIAASRVPSPAPSGEPPRAA